MKHVNDFHALQVLVLDEDGASKQMSMPCWAMKQAGCGKFGKSAKLGMTVQHWQSKLQNTGSSMEHADA